MYTSNIVFILLNGTNDKNECCVVFYVWKESWPVKWTHDSKKTQYYSTYFIIEYFEVKRIIWMTHNKLMYDKLVCVCVICLIDADDDDNIVTIWLNIVWKNVFFAVLHSIRQWHCSGQLPINVQVNYVYCRGQCVTTCNVDGVIMAKEV